jgi:hypothetical protein
MAHGYIRIISRHVEFELVAFVSIPVEMRLEKIQIEDQGLQSECFAVADHVDINADGRGGWLQTREGLEVLSIVWCSQTAYCVQD